MTLQGRKIVITRAREQATGLASLLEAAGAEVLVFPCIAIGPPDSWSAADDAIERLRKNALPPDRQLGRCHANLAYDWVVFTSANGVIRFAERCAAQGVQIRELLPSLADVPADERRPGASALSCLPRVAAVGPATAAQLEAAGVRPELVPADYVGESLLAALLASGIGPDSRILVLRAQKARDVLPDGLAAAGASVDVVPVYRTVTGDGDVAVLSRMQAGEADAVTFTSPSTVRGFVQLAQGVPLERLAVACIGPVAAAAARSQGLSVAIEPAEHTAAGLVCALEKYFAD